MFFHCLDLFGRMSLPSGNFSYNFKWLSGTIGFGGITREFFICQVRVIFNGAGWFNQINSFTSLSESKFCAPDGGIQCRAEENVLCIYSLSVVGVEASLYQVTNF